MYRTELPADLQKFVRASVLKRIVVFAVLEAVLAVLLLLWGDLLFRMENPGIRISCYALIFLVPFWVSGVPFKLTDRSFRGTVLKVKVETTVDNASPAKPTVENLYQKNTVHLLIRRDDGKTILKKVYEGKADRQQHPETYKEGDTVVHLYGTKQMVKVPEAADTHVCCAVCGNINSMENETCRKCGHTLIKD